jgi:uncharacterized membrane protein
MTQGNINDNRELAKPLPFHGNERLTFFSDGVFAITITLLVLEIKVPELAEDLIASKLSYELWHLVPKMLGHMLSFIVLGLYWIAHHNMFMHVKRHDHILLWLNVLFLMCIASIPFPTGLIGHYPDQPIAVIIYAATLALTGICLNLLWWYSVKYRLVDDDTDPAFIKFVFDYIRIAPLVYLLAIAASFLSLGLAKFMLIGVTVFYILPKRYHRKHYKQIVQRFEE